MKQIFIITLVLLSTCNKVKTSNKNNIKTNTKKITYFLNNDFGGDYSIYVNGINLLNNNESGVSHGYEYLNPLILKKGKQNITMIYKPFSKKHRINPADVKDIFLEIYSSENGENPPFKKVKRLDFPPIEKPVDSLMFTWGFDADVNYQNNELDNASDLTKENQNELLKAVLNKYQENHNIIDRGELDEYDKFIEERVKRETTSMYYSDEETKDYKNKLLQRVKSSKGLMQPIENYDLVIHLSKKIVSLVNKKGKPVLYSKDQNSEMKTYGLELYRDSKTGKLKVF